EWRVKRELQEGPARLDHPHRGGALRAVRQVHPPRLHASLAHRREQVQVSVPRERLLQDRHQLRRPGAAPARAPAHHQGRGRPAPDRQGRQVPLREGRLEQAGRLPQGVTMSGWDEIKRQITESQVWQSIFRHGYDDTPRNRILMVSGNVWLHLHPSKVRAHATRLRFTWRMGGSSFLLSLVTVVTGIYLMFYYRPTA